MTTRQRRETTKKHESDPIRFDPIGYNSIIAPIGLELWRLIYGAAESAEADDLLGGR